MFVFVIAFSQQLIGPEFFDEIPAELHVSLWFPGVLIMRIALPLDQEHSLPVDEYFIENSFDPEVVGVRSHLIWFQCFWIFSLTLILVLLFN